jgi:hypothetical protein
VIALAGLSAADFDEGFDVVAGLGKFIPVASAALLPERSLIGLYSATRKSRWHSSFAMAA